MKKIHILLLIIWMIVIFIFSHEAGISSNGRSDKIVSTVVSDITDSEYTNLETVNMWKNIIRKSAHLMEYTILGVLGLITLKHYKKLNIKLCVLVLLGCFIYACCDELHQYFIPGRDSNFIDVLIDTTGAFIGISIYYLIYQKKINKVKETI